MPEGEQSDEVLPEAEGEQPDEVLPEGDQPDEVLPEGEQPDEVLPEGEQPDKVLHEGEQPDDVFPTFQDLLAVQDLGMKILEFVFGDGWAEQCSCRRCERAWLNAGWICPVTYYRREYLQMLDTRYPELRYRAQNSTST